jgi:hypothetical protein
VNVCLLGTFLPFYKKLECKMTQLKNYWAERHVAWLTNSEAVACYTRSEQGHKGLDAVGRWNSEMEWASVNLRLIDPYTSSSAG